MNDFSQYLIDRVTEEMNFDSLIKEKKECCTNCKQLIKTMKDNKRYKKSKKSIKTKDFSSMNEFLKHVNINPKHLDHLTLIKCDSIFPVGLETRYLCTNCLTRFIYEEDGLDFSKLSFEKHQHTYSDYKKILNDLVFLMKLKTDELFPVISREYIKPMKVYGIYTRKLYRSHHKQLIKMNPQSFTEETLEYIHVYTNYKSLGSQCGFSKDYFKDVYLLELTVYPRHLFIRDIHSLDDIFFEVNRNDVLDVKIYNVKQDAFVEKYQKESNEKYDVAIREKFKAWNKELKEECSDLSLFYRYNYLLREHYNTLIRMKITDLISETFEEDYLKNKKTHEEFLESLKEAKKMMPLFTTSKEKEEIHQEETKKEIGDDLSSDS